MCEENGYTSRLVDAIPDGGTEARNDLLVHTWERLRRLARTMLRGFPKVARREEADDVVQVAAMRISEVLKSAPPVSALHYHNLSAQAIRRALLDLARKHSGPWGLATNHHTDGHGKSADDPGQPLASQPWAGEEPLDLDAWTDFHKSVKQLPKHERETFNLLWYLDLPQEKAAELLGVSVRQLKRRWQSARIALSVSSGAIPPA